MWGPRRRGWRGRPPKMRWISVIPPVYRFIPVPLNVPTPPWLEQLATPPPIILQPDELEALRLVDFEDLTQEEAGKRMNISRGTVWRLLQSARKKIIRAILEGHELIISPPFHSPGPPTGIDKIKEKTDEEK
ncbi:MAG: DUF134 domain-containing protein [Candidatus Asgardarchaeum sp.]